jgi:hypothetical protein
VVPADVQEGQTPLTKGQLQHRIYAYALSFLSEVAQAFELLKGEGATAAERHDIHGRGVALLGSVMSIAASGDPESSLLDMVVLVTLSRMVVEEQLIPEVYGERARPVLEALQSREDEIWKLAASVLDERSQRYLRQLIREWRDNHPDQQFVAYIRLGNLAPDSGRGAADELRMSFALLPEVDDTARAVDELRLVVERMPIYMDLMPHMIRLQAEQLLLGLLIRPEVQQLLANTDQLARASADFTAGMETLPQRVTAEAEESFDRIATRSGEEVRAATDHLVGQLASERKAIMEGLESQTGPIKEVLGESRETLATARMTAQALNEVIASLDALVCRFEADIAATTPAASELPPFDVNEYTAAASEVAVAAAELRNVIGSLDELMASPSWEKRIPEIAGMIGQVRIDGERWLDHAFRLGLLLTVVLLAGAVMAMLSYRYLSERLLSPRHVGGVDS